MVMSKLPSFSTPDLWVHQWEQALKVQCRHGVQQDKHPLVWKGLGATANCLAISQDSVPLKVRFLTIAQRNTGFLVPQADWQAVPSCEFPNRTKPWPSRATGLMDQCSGRVI